MGDPENDKHLRHAWQRIWRGLSRADAPEVAALLECYGEPHRHYHNGAHILDCLEEYARFAGGKNLARNPAMELAIFYHDTIYDPRAHDNEARSAEMARAALGEAVSPQMMDEIVRLIMATDHRHEVMREDERLIVDIDLSILGRPAAQFDAYELAIRAEYYFVPAEQFRAGRSKILQSFLARPRLYHTDYFFGRYEIMARDNLTHSLAKLK